MRSLILATFFLFNISIFCHALSPDSENGASISSAIELMVIADAGPDQTLNCLIVAVTLDGSGSSQGAEFEYEWSNVNGNFFSSELNPMVSEPGEYILKVTNVITNEMNTDTVMVFVNEEIPDFQINNPGILTCENSEITLDLTLDDPTIPASFNWEGPSGFLAFTEDVNVNEPGVYSVVVTNDLSGCSSQLDEFVETDIESSTTNIDFGTFSTFPIEIDGGSNVTNMSASYSWEARDGLQVDSFPVAIISKAGDYTLLEDLGSAECTNKFVYKVLASTLTADAGPDQEITCTNNTVTLGSNTNPTGSEFSYQWTDSSGSIIGTGFNVQVNQGGNYFLVITNGNTGEEASDEVEVTENISMPIVVAIGQQIISCNDPMVTIESATDISNANFQWTTTSGNIVSSANTSNIEVDQAGIYTIVVTDPASGCTATESIEVESIRTEPITINVPSITTTEPSVQLNPNDFFAPPLAATYFWTSSTSGNFNSSQQSIIVVETGIYTCVITDEDSGCITTLFYPVNFVQNLVADAGPDQSLTCIINTVIVGTQNTSMGSDISYAWTDEFGNLVGNDFDLTVDSPGQYQLTVTNNSTNETAVDVVIVLGDFEAPQINVAPTPTITCFAPTVNLLAFSPNVDAAFASYSWSGPPGGIFTDPNQASITVAIAGFYDVVVTNTENGCSATEAVEVNENTEIQSQAIPPITSTTPTFTIDPSTFIQDPNCSFAWTMQAGLTVTTFPLAEISQAGTYTFVKTNNQTGCTTTYFYTVQFANNTVADAGPDQELTCVNSSAILGTNNTSMGPDFTYSWTNTFGNQVGTTPFIEVVEPGTYTLTVSNTQNNTSDSDEVLVLIDQLPLIIINTPDILNCNNTIVTLEGTISGSTNASYEWSTFEGNILSPANQLSIDVDEPGAYVLTVSDVTNGCIEQQQILVEQNIDGGTFDIAPIQSSVYPINITAEDFPTGLALDFTWVANPGLNQISSTMAEISQPGQYTFIATNTETGCGYVYIYTVYNNVLADAGPNRTVNCLIESVTLDGTNSTAGSNIEYSWQDENGTQISTSLTPNVSEPGTYILQVTDVATGETIQDQVMVLEDTKIPVFNVSTPNPITFEEPSVLINASLFVPDAQDASFSWTTVDGNIISDPNVEDIAIDQPGIYELTVTNTINGCSGISTTVATQNFASEIIPLENIVATTFPITLDPSALIQDTSGIVHQPYPLERSANYEYKWVERQGLVVIDFPIAQAFQEGIYAFIERDLTTGFVTRYEYNINTMSISVVADAGPDLVIGCSEIVIENLCFGGGNTSEGSDFTYAWFSATGVLLSTDRIYKPTITFAIDIFPLTLVVTNSTTGEQATDVLDVVQEEGIMLDIQITNVSCFGADDGGVDITVVGGSSNFEISSNDPAVVNGGPLSPGNYDVTVTDLNTSCVTIATFVINEPDPLSISFAVDDNQIDAIVEGGVGAYTYDWSIDADSSIIIDPINNTEYVLTVTDGNGCTLTESFLFQTNAVFATNATEISVYPNPTDGILHLQFESQSAQESISLQIFDLRGIPVAHKKESISNDEMILDLRALQAGTYILNLIVDNEVYYQKIIVQ